MKVCVIGPAEELWLDELPESDLENLAKLIFSLDFGYCPQGFYIEFFDIFDIKNQIILRVGFQRMVQKFEASYLSYENIQTNG